MIFLNYRNNDTGQLAGRMAADLRAVFGVGQVFYDARMLEPGDAWPEELQKGLDQCQILMALIGERWLTQFNAYHRPRIDDPKDWVRVEISTSFERGKRVIPVLVDGATMPVAPALPEGTLREHLPITQHYTLRSRIGYEQDLAVLVDIIRKHLALPAPPLAPVKIDLAPEVLLKAPLPSRRAFALAGTGILISVTGLALALRKDNRGGTPPPPSQPLKPDLELTIYTDKDVREHRPGKSLSSDGVRPLRPGYAMRIEAVADKTDSSRKAYFYVFWLESSGRVIPLYPWRKLSWDDLPDQEEPVPAVAVPPLPLNPGPLEAIPAIPLEPGSTGIEAIVAVMTEKSLGATANQFRNAKWAQSQENRLPDPGVMAYLEDGRVDTSISVRAPGAQVVQTSDPVKEIAAFMQRSLVPLGASRAVCFGFQSQ